MKPKKKGGQNPKSLRKSNKKAPVDYQASFGDLYTEANVALSGIHTHSGPGGYLQYVLYDITALGFVDESYNALVDGIVKVTPILCFYSSTWQQ